MITEEQQASIIKLVTHTHYALCARAQLVKLSEFDLGQYSLLHPLLEILGIDPKMQLIPE